MKNIKDVEKQFWTEGLEVMQQSIDNDCVLILPPPISILRAGQIAKAYGDLPIWDKVAFEDEETVSRDQDNFICLNYKVKAIKTGQSEYHALCSSSYMKQGDHYILILHQQTPFME